MESNFIRLSEVEQKHFTETEIIVSDWHASNNEIT